ERIRHVGDLYRLENAVPRHVDDRIVDRLVLEGRAEVAPAVDRLKRRDRRAAGVADARQARRVVEVDLEPDEVERLQRPRQPDISVDLVVEVGVEMQPDALARTFAERRKLVDRGGGDVRIGVKLWKTRLAPGARPVHPVPALFEA